MIENEPRTAPLARGAQPNEFCHVTARSISIRFPGGVRVLMRPGANAQPHDVAALVSQIISAKPQPSQEAPAAAGAVEPEAPPFEAGPKSLSQGLSVFLAECCERGHGWVQCVRLWDEYEAWCRRNRTFPVSKKKFIRQLGAIGVPAIRTRRPDGHQVRAYAGIELRCDVTAREGGGLPVAG